MIAVLTDARRASLGVIRLLVFRKDWRSYFDTSAKGVTRSFAGIVLALPAFAFTVYAIDYFVAQNPGIVGEDSRLSLIEASLTWARYWIVFPITAALTCLAAGLSRSYASWLVVQNWTVFVLIHIQALIFASYAAGLADATALAELTLVYLVVRALSFWRVAAGALSLPPAYAAAIAGIPFVCDLAVRALTTGG